MRAHLERPTRPTPETLARSDAAARGDELEPRLLDAAIASATVAVICDARRVVAGERWTRRPAELNAGHRSRCPPERGASAVASRLHLRRDRARSTARRCAFVCRCFCARGRVFVRAVRSAAGSATRAAPRRRVADMRALAFIYATQTGKSRCLSPCKCALPELKRCDFPVYLFDAIRVLRVKQEFSCERRTSYAPFEIFYNSEPFL
ncbi:hypothetical protein WME76_16475 [Sorangium sp. So ce119]|uniref:hypothetical protein n=1 Tax=Sorangium sp. So ce119 TaxID=3133279 RepID=UPI003F61C1C0